MLFSSTKPITFSLQTLLKHGLTPTPNSITTFFNFLFNLRKFNLIINLFHQFTFNKIQIPHKTHKILTWALLNSHSFNQAEQFMMQNPHTPFGAWDMLIHGLCSTRENPERILSVLRHCLRFCNVGHVGKAIEVVELMNEYRKDYPFDDFVCSSVVSAFSRAGKPELSLWFFDNFMGSRPNLVTYTAVVNALCKLGRVDEVCGLVRKMEEDGLDLDVVLYSVWVCGYVEEKVLVEVFRKMREMVEKGICHDFVSYTILIDGFSKLGDVEKSFTFLAKMIKEGIIPNKVTYTAIMSAYCKKGRIEEAFGLFVRMKDMGIELDEFVFVVLIDGFGRVGDFDRVFQLLVEMEKRGIGPNVVTYNAVVNGLSKYGRTQEADEFSKNVTADVVTYSTLLHGYTEEDNVLGILQTKKRLEEAGISMDVVMCNVLIRALFMMQAYEDVYALYKGMPEMDLVPNSITYCTMIDGYCKVGKINEALEVFDDFRKTSISSYACYNSIINGLCKKGMVEMAIEALLELDHKGLMLDTGTHRLLMKTIFKENSSKVVLDLVCRMESLELDIYNAICNDSIFLLCKRGLLDDAYQLWMAMKKKGLPVTCKSYHSLLRRLLCVVGNREQILPLLNCFLKEYGLVEPKVQKVLAQYICLKDVDSALRFLGKTSYNSSAVTFPVSILKVLIKEGRALDAYKLLMGVQDDLPVMYVDYGVVIHGLCKGGYLNKALDLCTLIEKKGVNLNIVIYNSIINGLCHDGCLIEAFRLFDSLEKLNLMTSEITYATLIYALCREGYLQDAEHVFKKMVLNGFQPKTQVYNSLLVATSKIGQLEKAFELLNDMEKQYIKFDNFTVSSVINCYCQKGDMEGALEFYYKFKGKDISPDFLGFLYMIRGLCTKGRMEETRSVLREMLQSKNVAEMINIVNSRVDTESICDFIAALCDQGRIQEAVKVLNLIASEFFPAQRSSTCNNQGSDKSHKSYESVDIGSKSSTSLLSYCESGLDFESCDTRDKRNHMTNNDSHLKKSRLRNFDFYYSRIAALCTKGDLQDANELAKKMVSDMTESMN
uniref:Tetratricopeptide-like helical n=1 Tax=Medicago truncatula TaxID=3880 RepID=Q2HUM7_MEDTR|nr:Tetratricopeptide-like helical [Medicago truncatula]